jgi:drug/metabolite transporter (DMT)-like permease
MDWFFYAAASAVSFTVFSLVIRRFLLGKVDAEIFALLTSAVGASFLLIFSLFEKAIIHLSLLNIILIIVASIIYATVNVMFTIGRKLEDASAVSVIRQSSTVWAFLVGITLLGESLTQVKILGVGLIIFGNLAILWEGKKLELSRGLFLVLIASFLTGGISFIEKLLVGKMLSPALYGAAAFSLSSVWIFLYLLKRKEQIRSQIRTHKTEALVVGFLLALNVYLIAKAVALGEISKVVPIHNLAVILIVLSGIVFLKEQDKIPQKIIGAIIAFIGVFFLRD